MGRSILSQAVGVLSKDSFKKRGVRIAWTGFEGDEDEAIKSTVLDLKGYIVASNKPAKDIERYASLDFFVIPKDFLKRTIKLCSVISRGLVDIVTEEWVEASRKAGEFVPADGYTPLHLVSAVGNAIRALPSGGILCGYYFHVCSYVTGNGRDGKPPRAELKAMIESAGGLVVIQSGLSTAVATGKLIVVTTSADDEITSTKVAAVKDEAKFITLRNLFDVFISQSLDVLAPINFATEPETIEDEPETIEDVAPSKLAPDELETSKSTSPKPEPTVVAKTSKSPTKSPLVKLFSPVKSPLKYFARKKEKETGGDMPEILLHDPFKTPAKKDHQSSKAEFEEVDSQDDDDDFITPHPKPRVSKFEHLSTIKLTQSPERTTSRGKNSRQQLGGNGTLSIFGCKLTNTTQVIYTDEEGVRMFDSELDLGCLSDVYSFVKGNGGSEPFFFWEAYNKAHAAGGTTIKGAKTPNEAVGFRRCTFWFDTIGDLVKTLFYLFGESIDLVHKFLKEDGKMTELKKSLPGHAINENGDDMDTDEDGILKHDAPVAGIEIEEELGYNPVAESQPLW